MIMPKQKRVLRIFCCLILLSFNSCFEESEGCRDLTAANYNTAADNPCETCCVYPEAQVDINYMYDTLSFTFNTKYNLSNQDTVIVNELYSIFSGIQLLGQNSDHTVTDRYDINLDNTLDVEDLSFIDYIISPISLGNIAVDDSIISTTVTIGIPEDLDDMNFDYSNDPSIEEIVDSMYTDSLGDLEFFRVSFQIIAQDTTDWEVALSGQNHIFEQTFDVNQDINYGENLVILLTADIQQLFIGIDFESATQEDVSNTIVNNLKNLLF